MIFIRSACSKKLKASWWWDIETAFKCSLYRSGSYSHFLRKSFSLKNFLPETIRYTLFNNNQNAWLSFFQGSHSSCSVFYESLQPQEQIPTFLSFPSIAVFGGLIITGSWTIVAIDGYRFPSRAINSLYIPVIHSVHESTASIIDLG